MNKQELLETLKKEQEEIKEFNGVNVVLEKKRLSLESGILKAEIYSKDKLEYAGGILMTIEKDTEQDTATWGKVEIGQSDYFGFYLLERGKKLKEHVVGFFSRSFKEGKIQDLLKFLK